MRRLLPLLAATLLLPACRPKPTVHLPPDLQRLYPDLREPGAPDASLGAFGYKDRGAFKLLGLPSAGVLSTRDVMEVEYSEHSLRRLGVDANVLRAKIGASDRDSVGYRLMFARLESAWQTTDSLNQLLKRDRPLWSRIASRDTRIVDAVGVAYAYRKRSADSVSLGGSATLRGNTLFSGTASASGGRALRFGDGTILVYRLSKMCYSAVADSVTLVVQDGRGSDKAERRCPANSGLYPRTATR